MSSKTVSTWYYNEQLCFRTVCKYSFRYTWNFPKIWPYEYLFDDSLALCSGFSYLGHSKKSLSDWLIYAPLKAPLQRSGGISPRKILRV